MLKFLGIGSAFNAEMGNTAAYLKEGNNLLLLDCGATAFSRIMTMGLLDGVTNVFIGITHMHSDHVGSLGTLVDYLNKVKGVVPSFILTTENSAEEQEQTIKDYLTSVGVSEDAYEMTYADMMEDVFTDLKRITLAKVRHNKNLTSYAFELYFKDQLIIYVGDCRDTDFLKRVSDRIEKKDLVYVSFTARDTEGRELVTLEELADIFDKDKRANVVCMHFENLSAYNDAKELGFKVASRELSKAEILRNIASRN